MKILLAMPAYNEATHIGRVLKDVQTYIRDILVVDDGSTDATLEVLRSFPEVTTLHHPTNMGYGQSLIDAFKHAGTHHYDWVITMDCDEQHAPDHIPQFIQAAQENNADIISGSRYLATLNGADIPPPQRRAINMTVTSLLRCQLGLQLTDAFCGFKAYRVEALRTFHVTDTGYAMPLQVWAQAARAGLRVLELPIRLIYNDPSRHFGGTLDDPHVRLMHYVTVLREEMGGFRCSCLQNATECPTGVRIAQMFSAAHEKSSAV